MEFKNLSLEFLNTNDYKFSISIIGIPASFRIPTHSLSFIINPKPFEIDSLNSISRDIINAHQNYGYFQWEISIVSSIPHPGDASIPLNSIISMHITSYIIIPPAFAGHHANINHSLTILAWKTTHVAKNGSVIVG